MNCASILARRLQAISDLSDDERKAIKALPIRIAVLPPKHNIVAEGELASQCCLIAGGYACRTQTLEPGVREILSLHIAGDIPDLHSLHLPRSDNSLTTLTDSSVGLIAHEPMRELIRRYPRLGDVLWRETLIDAAIFRKWVAVGRQEGRERLAHLLCEMFIRAEAIGAVSADGQFTFPLTQLDMGDATGQTPVHVNRVLKDLREKGLLSFSRGKARIPDFAELAKVANFDPAYLHLRPTRGIQEGIQSR